MTRKMDISISIIFGFLTLAFIVLFLTNDAFFAWAFARHHNILSWYIRPLFIIPITVGAYKKSLGVIFISIFALFTSMFWFPVPQASSSDVLLFLAYEMDYLKGTWDAQKIIMSMAVPLFFIGLIVAAWRRKWRWLIGVIVAAAVLKVIWSVVFSGEAGIAILKPAVLGVIICVSGLYYYKKRQVGHK